MLDQPPANRTLIVTRPRGEIWLRIGKKQSRQWEGVWGKKWRRKGKRRKEFHNAITNQSKSLC